MKFRNRKKSYYTKEQLYRLLNSTNKYINTEVTIIKIYTFHKKSERIRDDYYGKVWNIKYHNHTTGMDEEMIIKERQFKMVNKREYNLEKLKEGEKYLFSWELWNRNDYLIYPMWWLPHQEQYTKFLGFKSIPKSKTFFGKLGRGIIPIFDRI